jgi:hypothetical protein
LSECLFCPSTAPASLHRQTVDDILHGLLVIEAAGNQLFVPDYHRLVLGGQGALGLKRAQNVANRCSRRSCRFFILTPGDNCFLKLR